MDYGQPTQQPTGPVSPEFFTSGAGTNDEKINNVQPENNLDLSNQRANWNAPIERNQQSIGQQTINSINQPNTAIQREETGQISAPSEIEMTSGNIIPFPVNQPNSLNPAIVEKPNDNEELSIENIKTAERLSDESIKIMEKIEEKLNKDGNAADFYDSARDATEKLVYNSFNRKLYKDTGGGKLAA